MAPETRGTKACRRLRDGTAIYTVGERDPGIRLDLFLKERIPKLSRRRIQDAIRTRVEAPGHGRPRPATQLRPGDTVIVLRAATPEEAEPLTRIPVLHIDDDLIVVDKPAGLLAHPSNRVSKGSVTHILSRQVEGPLHLIHRLDRETSGVMLVARSPEAARFLSAQVARVSDGFEKIYLAAVFGEMKLRAGTIDLPIGRALHSAVFVKRGVGGSEGRACRTAYRVDATGGGFSLVRVRLHTGRRHQIRVHLAAIGHPVVGDKLYGPAESHYLRFIKTGFDDRMRRELLTERQMLHAAEISLNHPRDGRRMTFAADLPPDMRQFLAVAGIAGGESTSGRKARA
ncbi:MAG TPA: RluA family pseudouridine synthase [Candidatus Polarisedimenticolia bacterium]|jgi:23S rRNA pseudouridine1911/1915/1917 synthase